MAVTDITVAAAKGMVDYLVDLLSVGTTSAAKVVLSDGAMPAHPGTGTPNTLVSIDLGTSAETNIFDAAATGTGGNANFATAGLKTALGSPSATAASAGTPTYFRAYDQAGTAVIQGDCGTGTQSLVLNASSFTTGQTVKITDWTVRVQYQSP